jgi:hypothetical protein
VNSCKRTVVYKLNGNGVLVREEFGLSERGGGVLCKSGVVA